MQEYWLKLYQTLSLQENERNTISFQDQLYVYTKLHPALEKQKSHPLLSILSRVYGNRLGSWTTDAHTSNKQVALLTFHDHGISNFLP